MFLKLLDYFKIINNFHGWIFAHRPFSITIKSINVSLVIVGTYLEIENTREKKNNAIRDILLIFLMINKIIMIQ